MTAAEWADMARVAQSSAPAAESWESIETLADAVESALDDSSQDEIDVARADQREADEALFEERIRPLEEAARELLADYEQTMDLVHVKDTRASAKMRDALLDLDRQRTRG